MAKQEEVRKRIYEFYLNNKLLGKKFIVAHFNAEKVPRSTIYEIIKRVENDSGYKRVQESGRVAKIMTPKGIKRLKTIFDHSDRVSMRQAGQKYGCSHSHIIKTLAKYTDIKSYKKQGIPHRQENQNERIKTGIDRLYRDFKGKLLIFDDESYFTLSHTTINGNSTYYSNNRDKAPPSVKYRKKRKFEPKVLVWLAASDKGISKPFFVPSGLAVSKAIYEINFIKRRLVPFINAHHADGNYIFWPDLASSHYAKTVTNCYETHNINFIQKVDNPPAVPKCRPIEDFWAILKSKVYESNWKAKDVKQLQTRINLCLKKIDLNLVFSLFGSTRVKVGRIRRNRLVEDKFN